ncbi:MAG: SOS response-associated peptidase [Flammeovirgaceae bacterium]|nr:SOS response-associated peptidase [Flammeovirgaceae bacterium]MDW8286934.1 SOS response-associated peptidase [Flammeovirgaceae bacterium]
MCGRYTFVKSIDEVNHHFSLQGKSIDYTPRWNAAPSQQLPVITQQDPTTLVLFRWGFLPTWNFSPLINVRSETVFEKSSFRFAVQYQRCLVVADGYYEWDSQGIPYYIRLPQHRLFAMAGIWEKKNCFAILTTQASEGIASLHDRMPLILSPHYYHDWLTTTSPEKLLPALISQTQQLELEFYTVSKNVNNVRNDSPDLLKPFFYPVQGRLF